MNQSPHHRPDRSITARAWALIAAGALIGAACTSDGPDADDVTSTDAAAEDRLTDADSVTSQPTVTEPTVTDSIVDPDEPVTDAEGVAVTEAPAGGEIEMTATIDFETGEGRWQVTEGADVFGCAGGSFTEDGFAAGVERTAECDDGPSSGSIVFRFSPEESSDERYDVTSDWNVHEATGEFVGLTGGGDWNASILEDGSGAEEVWVGSIEFDSASTGSPDPEAAVPDLDDAELGPELLVGLMDGLDVPDDADGAIVVAVTDVDGETISAADGNSPDGVLPGPDDPVLVGSISKVFVSLATLSLVDDGVIALDDPASDHITRAPVRAGVTVRDLLQHTSGIPDYVATDDFVDVVLDDRSRTWTPEESIMLVDGLDPESEPGAEFNYSSTNYLLLGLLLEELTGQPAHEVIRDRIIEPAGMTDTYLPGRENGPAPVPAYEDLPGRDVTLTTDVDDTSLMSSAWVAGAMISTGEDLDRMFDALIAGELISDESFAEMTANTEYGLGIEPWDEDDNLIGHGGSIPGFATLVFHHPESGRTAFFVSTDDGLSWNAIVEDVINAMAPDLADNAG